MKQLHHILLSLTRLGVGLSLMASVAIGQVRLGIEIEHESVLIDEPVLAVISIGNDADTPMVFGQDAYNAVLAVELKPGPKRTESLSTDIRRALDRDIIILPGDVHREIVDLGGMFPIRQQGSYRVSVRIEHDDVAYQSRERVFDVVGGIEIKSALHPVPGYRHMRLTYSLRYWRRRQSEHLFLVVTDTASNVTYGTFDLGRILRFVPPTLSYDRTGLITIVHQSGRERFTRSLFTVSGQIVDFVEQEHVLPDGSPYPTDAPVGIMRDPPRPAR